MKTALSRFLSRFNWLFWITVALPTLAAIVYYGVMASDVYVSESRFVVRSPERQAATSIGVILRSAGFSRAQDDAYTIQEFITSRDALQALEQDLRIGDAYGSQDVDPLNRFGVLELDKSFESLYKYYQKKITVQQDTASSISSLTVRAFTSEQAHAINRKLLELSESLVNRLNERGRQDMIRFAATEVASAEQKAKTAALALSSYRNVKGVIDPERQAAVQLQQVAKLQEELIATKTQLAQLQAYTPLNPQIPALQTRAKTLQGEIDSETAKVTGDDRSLAKKAADFQRLALEREFADRQLASAMASLETARNEAQRKQVYLERVSEPNRPDTAIEPRRLRGIVATFAFGMIAWGILSMLLAGVKEHQE